MESICIFCSSPLPSGSSTTPPSYEYSQLHQLFELISINLSVEPEIIQMWNFSQETLPFCPECTNKATSLSNLHQQLDSIQLEINLLLEEFKDCVKKSAGKNRKTTTTIQMMSSLRFDNFRQQVLGGNNKTRRICSSRVATITGLTQSKRIRRHSGSSINSFVSSVESWDDLSVDLDFFKREDMSTEYVDLNTTLEEIPDGEEPPFESIETILLAGVKKDKPPGWVETDELVSYANVKVIPPDKDSNFWKCSECDFKFEKKYTKQALSRHILQKHYKKECPTCRCTFTASDLQDHLTKSSSSCYQITLKPPPRPKTCRKCNVTFENMSQLKIHACSAINNSSPIEPEEVVNTKPKPIFKCENEKCNKILSSKAALQRHMDTHTKTLEERKDAVCEKCGIHTTQNQLIQHLRLVHKEGTPLAKYECQFPDCFKSFPHMTRLKRHQKTSHKELKNNTIKRSISFEESFQEATFSCYNQELETFVLNDQQEDL